MSDMNKKTKSKKKILDNIVQAKKIILLNNTPNFPSSMVDFYFLVNLYAKQNIEFHQNFKVKYTLDRTKIVLE